MQQYGTAWNAAQSAAATPFHMYGGEFTAGMNQTQNQATTDIQNSKNLYQPYFSQAQTLAQNGAQPMNIPQFSAEALQQYQNPYMNQVVNATMAQLGQQQAMDQSSLKGKQMMSGAFGGSRSNIDTANLMRQQEMASGSTLSGLLSGGYQQALGEFNQQQGMSLQQQEAQRQQQMQAAGLMSNLGTGANQMSLQNAQALMGAGSLQQQTQQNQDTAVYNQFLAQQQYPFQTAQFLANVAEGTGSLEGGTTTTKTPKPFFSDERVKENIALIGKSYDGQPIYRFHYKGDKTAHIGFIAQEVEKMHPHAVGSHLGIKTVDYDAATEKSAKRGHFADGGAPSNPNDFSAPTIPQEGQISYVPQPDQSAATPKTPQGQQGQQNSGSTLGDIAGSVSDIAKIGSGIMSIAGLFSDERVKENIQPIGESFTGHHIYRYNYKGDPTTHMGLIAQEVEKRVPEAVGDFNGIKTVNYETATQGDSDRGRFAQGGSIGLPVSYVPTFSPSGGHSVNIPQVPAYQKPTSVLQDISGGIDQAKGLWNTLPTGAQNTISSMNPIKPAAKDNSLAFNSPSASNTQPLQNSPSMWDNLTNLFSSNAPVGQGGLYNKGGSVRNGYDIGGSVNEDNDQDDSDKVQIPSALMGYPPLAPTAYGAGSTPMPNVKPQMQNQLQPQPDAKEVFKAGLQTMEGPANGPQQSDKSSAYGPYQFTKGTWNDLIAAHPELNMTPEDRLDANKQKIALNAWTDDLSSNLQKNGQDVTAGNLYQSHMLGVAGGPRMVQAAKEDPNAPAYMNATPAAVNSNHAIFFNKDNTPRSTGEVAQIMSRSIEGGKGWQGLKGEAPIPPANIPLQNSVESPAAFQQAPITSDSLSFSGPQGQQATAQQSQPEGGGLSSLFSVGPNGLSPTQKGLLNGVFGMLASPSTTLLGSLGEGGLKGMGAYQSGQDTDITRQLNMANMQRAQAQTGLEQQKLAFEQQKLPYELQATMAKTGAQRAIAASRLASAMGFTPSIDTTTGKTVYTDNFGQQHTPEQLDQYRQNTLNPMYQQLLGPNAGMPSISPQGGSIVQAPQSSAGAPTTSVTPQQAVADPAGAVASGIQQGQTVGQAVDTQQQKQTQAEDNFYKKNNVPPDQDPSALKDEATSLRQKADAIRFQNNKHPAIVKQMEDFDAQAKEKDAKAKTIEDSMHTKNRNGDDVSITPLIDMKNKQKAQEAYSGQLPASNDKVLEETSKEGRTAQNIKASAVTLRNLLYDDKTKSWNYKTGSFEGLRSALANMLASSGADSIMNPTTGRTLSQDLTGMNPGDDKMLTHIMGLAVPSLTRENLQGQRTTQGEFMHFTHVSPEPGDVPKLILKMIDTQLLPEAQYKIDRANHLTQPKVDKDGKPLVDEKGDPVLKYNRATDDYATALASYDRTHNLNDTYNSALDDWKKKEKNLPSQSPFSNVGSGLKAAASHALGFDQNAASTAPQANAIPQAPTGLPPTQTINGHQMYLWPNGKYSDAPPPSTASKGD